MNQRQINHKITLDQIRSLFGPESGLLALVLAALVAWTLLSNQASGAEEAMAKDLQNLKAAQEDLSYWTKNFDQLALLQDLEETRALPPPPDLPTRQDAVGFRNRFLTYAGEQHLPLNTLEVTEVERNLGEADFPAVRYSIVVTGPLKPLIAALDLLNNYPTALVDDIEYFQADEDGAVWAMTLNLEVLYHEQEGQG